MGVSVEKRTGAKISKSTRIILENNRLERTKQTNERTNKELTFISRVVQTNVYVNVYRIFISRYF